jgi:putative transcriptional regulator
MGMILPTAKNQVNDDRPHLRLGVSQRLSLTDCISQEARLAGFETLAGGSVRRRTLSADGQVEATELLNGPQWQVLAARMASGLTQSQFAKAAGVSVRTLQEWEQGRKAPSGPAQGLLRLVSRHPELLAELA